MGINFREISHLSLCFSSPEIKLKSVQITINKARRRLQIFCVDVHLAYERRHNKSTLEVCFHWMVAFSFLKYCRRVVYPSTTLGRSWEKMKKKKINRERFRKILRNGNCTKHLNFQNFSCVLSCYYLTFNYIIDVTEFATRLKKSIQCCCQKYVCQTVKKGELARLILYTETRHLAKNNLNNHMELRLSWGIRSSCLEFRIEDE